MRDAIGRPSASFLADSLTTTTHQRISAATHAATSGRRVHDRGRHHRPQYGRELTMMHRSATTWSILGRRSVPSSLSLRSTPLGLPGLTAPHRRLGWAFT